jgi:asparagine synthetase B (glutamine-hydrolysing)
MGNIKYRDIATFNVRMQPDLKKKLEAFGLGKVKWSLNGEINKRLEDSLVARHELEAFSDGELIDELIKRWGRDNVLIRLGNPTAGE